MRATYASLIADYLSCTSLLMRCIMGTLDILRKIFFFLKFP